MFDGMYIWDCIFVYKGFYCLAVVGNFEVVVGGFGILFVIFKVKV